MTEAELLAAIARDLDDDAPRLVYADWLAERGDPRGEFIQVQCQLARAPRRVLEYRERRLLGEHQRTWTRALDLRARSLNANVVVGFERGFPEKISGNGRVSSLLRVLELAPTARALSIGLRGETEAEVLAELDLVLADRSWRELSLHAALGDEGAARLAASPSVARLEALGFVGARLGDDGLRALARLPIASLAIEHNRSPLNLAELGRIRGLRRLVLEDDGVIALGGLAGLSLASLSVTACRLSPESVVELGRAFPVLDELTLEDCNVRDVEVAHLPRAPRLSLVGNQLGPEAAWHLAGRAELVQLNLAQNAIGDDGARVFAASDALGGLRRLFLGYNGITEAGLDALARSPRLLDVELYVDRMQPLQRRRG